MSKFIKNDRKGITIDANALLYRNDMSPEALARGDILIDPKRKNFLKTLIDKETKKINPKMKQISDAYDEYNRVLEHNQKLLDRGVDPRDPKNHHLFKIFDSSKVAALVGIFSRR